MGKSVRGEEGAGKLGGQAKSRDGKSGVGVVVDQGKSGGGWLNGGAGKWDCRVNGGEKSKSGGRGAGLVGG